MTCPLCQQGLTRSWGEHFRISERGVAKVGPCTAPDEVVGEMKPDTFRERLAAWVERIHAPVVAAIVAPVNPNAPRPFSEPDDEEDES